MINGFMLITGKGDLLISRLYREDVKGAVDIFRTHVIASKEVRAPLKQGFLYFSPLKSPPALMA